VYERQQAGNNFFLPISLRREYNNMTNISPMRRRGLGTTIIVRWILALILVVITFNPTGLSFLHWIGAQIGTDQIFEGWPLKVFLTLILGVMWYFFLKSAIDSLRMVILALASVLIMGAYIVIGWVNDAGYVVGNTTLWWFGEILIATILALGVSAGHIRAWWSGTRQTDDVDD
jgi:hypothetical protein